MGTYLSIKNSVIALLKGLYPTFDVFSEEISDTEYICDNYIFVDIIPVGNVTMNKYHTERSLLIDIAVHNETEKNEDYLMMADAIDNIIRPAFRFEDRAITINQSNSKIVDKVLHYTFDLIYIDTVEVLDSLPYMEMIDVKIKERS